MILRTKGPDRLPAGYQIVLYISMADADRVGVFYVESEWAGPAPAVLSHSALAELSLPPGGPALPSKAPRPPYAVVAPQGQVLPRAPGPSVSAWAA